jgi:hypothetical protein
MAWVIEEPPEQTTGKWAIEPPAKEDIPLKDVPGMALKSLPGSAFGVAKDIAGAMVSPVQTMHGLGEALTGAVNLATPEGVPDLTYYGHRPGAGTTGEEQARAVGEMYKEQYGGLENIKRTLAEDPAVPLMDLATVLSGGGALASKAPGLAGQIARGTVAPMKAVSKIPSKVISPLAQKLYGLPIKGKFPEAAGFGMRRKAVEAGRKLGVTMDEPGAIKLQGRIKELGAELDDILLKAEKAGAKTDVLELWNQVDDLKKGAELSAKPIDLQRAVDRLINQHTAAMESAGKKFYTPKELNTLKRALADRVKYSSVPGATTADDLLASERAASAARETLRDIDPSIERLNKELAPLMALRGPQYSTAFKGRVVSEHPIIAGSVGRMAAGTPGGMGAMAIGPNLMARGGISLTKLAESPLLQALSGPAQAGAYSTTRLGGRRKR